MFVSKEATKIVSCSTADIQCVGTPLERIALEFLRPLSEKELGNRCILIIMEYFSKWTEANAIPDQSAATVAHVLVAEVICWFGVPLQIHTNRYYSRKCASF